MFAKVIVFTLIATVLCEEHGYSFRNHHEPAKEYRQRYEHIPIRVHEEPESSNELQYNAVPESHGHGHAYSSQSIIHHSGLGSQGDSQESHNDHVAPVYQYVQEEEAPAQQDAPAHNESPALHYQSVHFAPAQPQHEVKSQGSAQGHAQPHYIHGHGGMGFHRGNNAHEGFSFHHGAQLHTALHHSAPVHHAAPVHHTAPVHHAIPVHHTASTHQEAPIHHEAPIQHAVPVHHEVHAHDSHDEPIDYYAYPKYQYEYKVEDPHTGDNKFQHEIRDGDVVKGVYSLQEADGSFRTVEYSSDKHTGFTAIVKHSAPGQHVQIESHHHN